MSHFLISVLAMAAVLGFMILIHELGHFASAKYFGVRVEVFSIGFGTRLLGFRRGDTDYRISAIPLGGYVKMSGENPMDDRTGDPGEFMSHPRWQRLIVAISGPMMNILLAIGLLTVVYMVHFEYPAFLDQPAVVGWVIADTPAARAGLQSGDRIARIDDVENPTWEQVTPKEYLSPNQPLEVVIDRNGQKTAMKLTPEAMGLSRIGSAGWVPKQPSVTITDLEPGMPAERAGLQVGDEIRQVNHQPILALEAMVVMLKTTKDQPIVITVQRNGRPLDFTVAPVLSEVSTPGEKRYRIGISSIPMKVTRLPFGESLSRSWDQNKRASFMILELVQKMVERKISMRSVEGPIRIGQAAGQAAMQKGWMPLLELTAAISLNLGIFNLLPIPILDGGMILFLLFESVIRRDISLQIKERIYQVAFVFLVVFAGMVVYNDLIKTLPGLAGRLP